jgi:hypothetical protein
MGLARYLSVAFVSPVTPLSRIVPPAAERIPSGKSYPANLAHARATCVLTDADKLI